MNIDFGQAVEPTRNPAGNAWQPSAVVARSVRGDCLCVLGRCHGQSNAGPLALVIACRHGRGSDGGASPDPRGPCGRAEALAILLALVHRKRLRARSRPSCTPGTTIRRRSGAPSRRWVSPIRALPWSRWPTSAGCGSLGSSAGWAQRGGNRQRVRGGYRGQLSPLGWFGKSAGLQAPAFARGSVAARHPVAAGRFLSTGIGHLRWQRARRSVPRRVQTRPRLPWARSVPRGRRGARRPEFAAVGVRGGRDARRSGCAAVDRSIG